MSEPLAERAVSPEPDVLVVVALRTNQHDIQRRLDLILNASSPKHPKVDAQVDRPRAYGERLRPASGCVRLRRARKSRVAPDDMTSIAHFLGHAFAVLPYALFLVWCVGVSARDRRRR